jgi:hypothetical protein
MQSSLTFSRKHSENQQRQHSTVNTVKTQRNPFLTGNSVENEWRKPLTFEL